MGVSAYMAIVVHTSTGIHNRPLGKMTIHIHYSSSDNQDAQLNSSVLANHRRRIRKRNQRKILT